MSAVRYAFLCNKRIVLSADEGVGSFSQAAAYAPYVGLMLPGIDRFQCPNHGSRRNVSTEMLDQRLGPRLRSQPVPGQESYTAIIGSAKADADHSQKAVNPRPYSSRSEGPCEGRAEHKSAGQCSESRLDSRGRRAVSVVSPDVKTEIEKPRRRLDRVGHTLKRVSTWCRHRSTIV
jgi:hypothetical protein